MQRGAIQLRQAQAKGLPVQVVLQRLMAACPIGSIGVAVIVVVLSGGRIASPFDIVGGGLDRAIALPAFFQPSFRGDLWCCISIILARSACFNGACSY